MALTSLATPVTATNIVTTQAVGPDRSLTQTTIDLNGLTNGGGVPLFSAAPGANEHYEIHQVQFALAGLGSSPLLRLYTGPASEPTSLTLVYGVTVADNTDALRTFDQPYRVPVATTLSIRSAASFGSAGLGAVTLWYRLVSG